MDFDRRVIRRFARTHKISTLFRNLGRCTRGKRRFSLPRAPRIIYVKLELFLEMAKELQESRLEEVQEPTIS
jgi:hypothetical protein